MGLEIVWRNPAPPSKSDCRLERIDHDKCGAAYVVTIADETEQFDVITGGACSAERASASSR